MLHFNTIDTETLELLRALLAISAFSDLRLAGDTGMALQIGHGKSIDVDLFGTIKADEFTITQELKAVGRIKLLNKSENIKIYTVNDIKVDLVNYPYPWLSEINSENNLRLAGIDDIAAMKLSAITNRVTKKDFVDIFFLLQSFSLTQMLDLYSQKYQDGSEFLVLKSLAYFNDAESDEMPYMLQQVSWPDVKQKIRSALKEY
ncbi:nucleotidyl transferase AbiEii/AbiGii toxin family protein [bacterium]|nr:nucleotidyl transferase AbiEii/AbiGii toxin family protein [candidate division CSSED10-310 bacterium]